MNPNLGGRTSTTWQKGQSGNPLGPKAAAAKRRQDAKALARTYTSEAIETLARLMKNPKTPPATRVSAATALLDRGHGKPLQTIDMTTMLGMLDLTRLSDQQLEDWEQLIKDAAGPNLDRHNLPSIIEGELLKPLEPEPSEPEADALEATAVVDDRAEQGPDPAIVPVPNDRLESGQGEQ